VTDAVAAAGRHVILVDDVLTSGATMRECDRILREAGVLSVTGVALARTVRVQEGESHIEEDEKRNPPVDALLADSLVA